MNIENIFRAATRPAIAIIFAATIAQVVTQRIDAPDWFIAMAGIVIVEWWSERAVTRIKNKGADSNQPSAVSKLKADS